MPDYLIRLQNETDSNKDIIYRKKKVKNKILYIVFIDSLINGTNVSDFIVKSLDEIKIPNNTNILKYITENIYNFKAIIINDYKDMCFYLNNGFTIIIGKDNKAIALETKSTNKRAIDISTTENTMRGPKWALTEDYQTNLGLIRKVIRSNNLWSKEITLGTYTKTRISILYLKDKANTKVINQIYKKLKDYTVDGVFNSGSLRNVLGENSLNPLPSIMSTERPDRIGQALTNGKICILVDNDPYVLILPVSLNDFFKTEEDYFSKNINASLTRILRFISFYIALFTPAIYIALITYNQEMLPIEFLINFAMQRNTVPFPAFFEAFMMMACFELLHESDLRSSGFSGSSLSIVGALILGEAAVNAGIVSPIMIIVIALTAIASLPFNEYELVNGIRWYRILFMISASFLGVVGIIFAFIYFAINLVSSSTYKTPYLTPFIPINRKKLKDSIIKI